MFSRPLEFCLNAIVSFIVAQFRIMDTGWVS